MKLWLSEVRPLPRFIEFLEKVNYNKIMSKLNKIKKILSNCKEELKKEFKVKEISIFGSLIRGKMKKKSDIDVLVDFEEGADLFDLIGLALYLEKKLGRKVDVVPKRALRKEIKRAVLRERVPV